MRINKGKLTIPEVSYIVALMHPDHPRRVEPVLDPAELAESVNVHFGLKGARMITPEEISSFQRETHEFSKKSEEMKNLSYLMGGKNLSDKLNWKSLTKKLNARLGYSENQALGVECVKQYAREIRKLHARPHLSAGSHRTHRDLSHRANYFTERTREVY